MISPSKLYCLSKRAVAAWLLIMASMSNMSNAQEKGFRLSPQERLLERRLNHLKVVNYFPSANGWTNMWDNWYPSVIDEDFATIASMHANTVRIIVNVQSFGFPVPSAGMVSELSQIVTLANKHGLQVQLTLFDWFSNYSDVSDSETWAATVLGPYKNDSRIAFIELQNEIDPGDPVAMTWAKALIPHLRNSGGNIPVTVSITDGKAGGAGAELPKLMLGLGTKQPDFYNVHLYYDAPYSDFYELTLAKAAAKAKGRALFVGETGQSTNAADYTTINFPHSQASYEAFQDYFYRATNYVTSTLGLPTAAPWILRDFQPGSLTSLGWPPNSDQYNFGLYRADGSAKPAAATVSGFFGGSMVDITFNNGFEQYEWDPATSLNLPMLWQVYQPNLGHFQIDATVAHTGSAAAEIWNSSSSPGGNPSFFIAPIANISPGTQHTASTYVMGKNASGTTQICLAWFAADFSYIDQSCNGSLSGTTMWEQISVTAKAPQNVAWAEIFLTSFDNQGAAWFDDVVFQ